MGVLQRFERRLGGMVEGVFARAFKSEVQPVEVAAALQRELDDRAAVVGRDRTLVPNHFVVELGDHDHDRLAPYAKPLTHELAAMVREHADDQRYTFVGPVLIDLQRVSTLETGLFRIRSDVAPGPEGMPDLSSLPSPEPKAPVAVPGAAPVGVPTGVPSSVPAGSATGAPSLPDTGDVAMTTAIPRMPAPASYGHLLVREGKAPAYDFELKHKVTVIGRGTDADVRLTDQAVSRHHAEVRVANGSTMLNDLQSTNGTTVNGLAITTTALADGDEIKLGETVLTFRASANTPAAGGRPGAPVDRGPWS